MDVIQCILVVVSVIVLTRASSLPDGLSIKSAVKRSAPEQPIGIFDSDYDAVDKRMRYGKRSSYDDYFDDGDDLDKRATFRFGKRDEMNEDDVKRLFRLGRSDGVMKRMFRFGKRDSEIDQEKRKQFRFGKRDLDIDQEKRQQFRFGKRDWDMDQEKRQQFRFGKRDWDMDLEKRQQFRFGKRDDILREDGEISRDIREEPHIPFRYGHE